MSGCSSGYIPFSLAASPFLKVVGKTMFVKWKIKGNMATLFLILTLQITKERPIWMESTATENFKHETLPCLTLKKQSWFFQYEQFTYTLDLFSLDPSFKATHGSDIWAPLGQWILTWCTFRKLFLSPKFPSSSFQEQNAVFLIFFFLFVML